jgi:hypothetical protein
MGTTKSGLVHVPIDTTVPTVRKVKLAELRDHLPSDTLVIDAAERDLRIRARARALQMRIKW